MIVSVIGCAAVVAGLGLFAYANKHNKKENERSHKETDEYGGYYTSKPQLLPSKAFLALCAAGALMIGSQCLYTQDAGDVVVLRDFGGNIAGYTSETGFHTKAPWQDCIVYDIRNNVITFAKDGSDDYMGGSATGNQVTINDASGVQADMDIQVNYSLDPTKAVDIYRDYGTQENFVKAIAAVDVRSVPREISGQFDTITLLTDRGQFTQAVEQELASRWEKYGLVIEQVSVQEIRYPESVTSKYAEAQQALIDREKAQNEQETAKVQSETKRIEAEGEAEANRILNESLTDRVIQQQYIDALKNIGENGNLVVVPENSQPIVNTNK